MRCSRVPDNFVGDMHLTNWFKKNMGMTNLKRLYVEPSEFCRDELTRTKVHVVYGSTIYMEFNDKKVVKFTNNSNLYMEKL